MDTYFFKSDRYYIKEKPHATGDLRFMCNMYDSFGDDNPVAEVRYSGREIYISNNCTITGGTFNGGTFYGGTIHGGKFIQCVIYGGTYHNGDYYTGDFYGGEYHDGEYDGGTFYNGEFHGGVFVDIAVRRAIVDLNEFPLLEIYGGSFDYGDCHIQKHMNGGNIFSGTFINTIRQ